MGRFEILSMNIGFLFFQVINAHQLDLSFLILNLSLPGFNLLSLGFDLFLPGFDLSLFGLDLLLFGLDDSTKALIFRF
ncbi:hypothetical protein C7123_00410 [Tannerella serpentiformis]|nr:hypothetical protein C7123_00410 [Tannerella serpentiformis]